MYTQYSNDPELKDILVGQFFKDDDAIFMIEAREALPYWLQQAKRLTADKARLTIDMHADANNYQVQGKEIGELRKQLKRAEEREQKLKSLIEIAMGGLIARGSGRVADNLRGQLLTLYPLEREDTTNES